MLPLAHHKSSPYLFIANWKMYFSYQEAFLWAATHFKNIAQTLQDKHISFVVCPSSDALANIASYAQQHTLPLGAQDCSAYEPGAYTGQVAARSLAELGCTYCIVGHSETRTYQHVSNNDVAQKVQRLFDNNITPVICIGETRTEYEQSKTLDILQQQLKPLIDVLKNAKTTCVAYEPIWSIGTDNVPSTDHLKRVYTSLATMCSDSGIKAPQFIYGGSVDETTIQHINEIPHIQGVLVGRASTDFQKIKTIVSLIREGC